MQQVTCPTSSSTLAWFMRTPPTPCPIPPLLVCLSCIALPPSVDGNTVHLTISSTCTSSLRQNLYNPSLWTLSGYQPSRTPLSQFTLHSSIIMLYSISHSLLNFSLNVFFLNYFIKAKSRPTFINDAKWDSFYYKNYTLKLKFFYFWTTASSDGLHRIEEKRNICHAQWNFIQFLVTPLTRKRY